MASNKPRNLNTIISKFYGGMSQDNYIGGADASGQPMSFFDGSGIEISKNARFVELSNNDPIETSLGATSSVGNVIAYVSTGAADQLIITDKGFCYPSNSTTYVLAEAAGITNAFTAGGYGHLIKKDGTIGRWTLTHDTGSFDTGIGAGYANAYANVGVTLTGNNPYIIDSGFLYLANANKIYRLDLSTAGYPVVLMLTVDIGFTIKAITQIGDRFYIYASDGTLGIQYLWSGSNVTTGGNLTKIRWYDKPIINVANINNIDYVVVGDGIKRALYRVNGYQPDLLQQSDFITNSYKNRFIFKPDYTNAIETISNLIFIPADGCIYTYGKINPLLPDATVRKITFNGLAPTCIVADYYSTYQLHYFYQKGANTYKVTLNLSQGHYGTDPGTIIFNPIISNIYSSKDNALKVRVGYDLTENTKINVYFKPDYQGGYANFYADSFTVSNFPVVGDTYTYNSTTYTVYAVTATTGANIGIVHCTYTWPNIDITEINDRGTAGTMTRATGTGVASFTFYRRTLGMKLADTITDTTEHKQLISAEDPCYQMTFMLDLITTDNNVSPRLWDFVYAYGEIENDI